MHEEDGARLVLAHFPLEILERHAEIVSVAVDELDLRARAERRERSRHERVRRAEDRLAAHAGPFERGERRAGPPVERDRLEAVPGRPLTLELGGELTFRPALGIEHAVPEPVQERAVAVVETDRKPRKLGREVWGQHRALPYIRDLRALLDMNEL